MTETTKTAESIRKRIDELDMLIERISKGIEALVSYEAHCELANAEAGEDVWDTMDVRGLVSKYYARRIQMIRERRALREELAEAKRAEAPAKKLENVKASAENKQYTIDDENACIVNIAAQLVRGIQCELEADTDDATKAWHLVSTIEEAARRVAQANTRPPSATARS